MPNSYPIPTHPSWSVVDSTKLQQYKDCPRKFFYEYLLGWRPDTGDIHLNFGKIFHKAMEIFTLGQRDEQSLINAITYATEAFDAAFGNMAAVESDRFKGKTLANLIKALELYRREFSGDNFDPLAIEQGNYVLLTENPERRLYYKLDMLVLDKDTGKVYVQDYKTTGGNLEGVWAEQFILRMQIGTYLHVAYCIYPPEQVGGALIDGVAFQKTQIKFKRAKVRKSPAQMENWWTQTLQWYKRMEEDFNQLANSTPSEPTMKAFPMNESHCTAYFSLCPFHHLCTSRHNPLTYDCSKPPNGFKQEFWDPTKEDAK